MKAVLAFPLVRLVLIVAPLIALIAVTEAALGRHHSVWSSIVATAITVFCLVLLMIFVERCTTRRSPAEIGFDTRNIARDLVGGVALGAGLFCAVVLELAAGGHYRIVASNPSWDVAIAVLFFALGAAFEELLFRGVLFRLIEEWAGTWIALGVSAVLFGAAHALNPGATWVSTVAIALEAGVLLAAAFVVTKNLWFPIGLHFAWNFCEGPIFGGVVSGHSFLKSLFVAQIGGPAWLTGGTFGPEAGVAAIATCSVVSIALLVYAERHSLIIKKAST